MTKDIKHTAYVTTGILASSFFSYLLQFFLGRILRVEDYGTFNTLLSIAAITGVPAAVLGTALVKKVANLKALNENEKVAALFWNATLWAAVIGLIVFLFFYISKDSVFAFIKLDDRLLAVLFGAYLGLTFLWSIPYAYFQGLQKYLNFSLYVSGSSFLRLALPILFLAIGISMSSIFLGIFFALLVSYAVSFFGLRKHVLPVQCGSSQKELWEILKISSPILFTNIFMMLISNNDMILVRRYFDPTQSGYYAGVVTLGKILLFGSGAVSVVMFPRIAALKAEGKELKTTFYNFLKMQIGVVGLGAVLFSLFPRIIAVGFFGEKFLNSTQYLPLFSVFVTLYVVLNYIVMFLLATDKFNVQYLLVPFVIMQYMALSNFHASLYQIIFVNILVLFLACVAVFSNAVFAVKRQ